MMIRSSGGFILRKSKTWSSIPNTSSLQYMKQRQTSHSTSNNITSGTNRIPNNDKVPSSSQSNGAFTSTVSFATGSLAGLLGSLAGMGGGFVMIPLMTSRHVGLRLTQHEAHGTSLFAVAATGLAGAFSYYSASISSDKDDTSNSTNVVHIPEACAIALTAMITARWGAQATLYMSGLTLKRALGCLMLLMAPAVPAKAYFIQQSIDDTTNNKQIRDVSEDNFSWNRLFYPALIGIGSGFLSGLFGVGGGTIVVPALTVLTDLTHHEALGTSLAAMTIPAMSGTYTHYRAGNCSLRVAPFLATGALFGAYIGAKQAMHMDESTLRWGFAALLATLGGRTLIRG